MVRVGLYIMNETLLDMHQNLNEHVNLFHLVY
jgi:hypothetical protein